MFSKSGKIITKVKDNAHILTHTSD